MDISPGGSFRACKHVLSRVGERCKKFKSRSASRAIFEFLGIVAKSGGRKDVFGNSCCRESGTRVEIRLLSIGSISTLYRISYFESRTPLRYNFGLAALEIAQNMRDIVNCI